MKELIIRLILASILGGIIGIEREIHNRPAGLRTHILVTVGSALIMLISIHGFNNGDPARLSAQVVSGIGFLGGGTILRGEKGISGLTTAASIWVCGGIGLAIGDGYYVGAYVTTAIVLFTLLSSSFLENKNLYKKCTYLKLNCTERTGLIEDIGKVVTNNKATIKGIKIYEYDNLKLNMKIELKISSKMSLEKLQNELAIVEGIQKIF